MKRILLLLILFAMLLCSGCNMTLMGKNDDSIPYETFGTKPVEEDTVQMAHYKSALDDLANLRYESAYKKFLALGDFRDAAEYAARFAYIEDTLLQTEQYTNGTLTGITQAAYDLEGNLQTGAGSTGTRMSYIYDDNGNLQEETWLYSDYILIKRYNTYTNPGTLASEEKQPHNLSADSVEEGYRVTYVYDADGLLVKDKGEEHQYILEDGKSSTQSLLYNGTYTYDEAGNLIRYDREYTWGGQGSSWTSYTYDDQGRLIREESCKQGDIFFIDSLKTEDRYLSEICVFEYSYDADDNLILLTQSTQRSSMFDVLQKEVETYFIQTEYTYEDGRIATETVTFGESSDTVIETCYVYGDYLGYIYEEDPNGE